MEKARFCKNKQRCVNGRLRGVCGVLQSKVCPICRGKTYRVVPGTGRTNRRLFREPLVIGRCPNGIGSRETDENPLHRFGFGFQT